MTTMGLQALLGYKYTVDVTPLQFYQVGWQIFNAQYQRHRLLIHIFHIYISDTPSFLYHTFSLPPSSIFSIYLSFFFFLSFSFFPFLSFCLSLLPIPLLIFIEQMFMNLSMGLWCRCSEIKGNILGFGIRCPPFTATRSIQVLHSTPTLLY